MRKSGEPAEGFANTVWAAPERVLGKRGELCNGPCELDGMATEAGAPSGALTTAGPGEGNWPDRGERSATAATLQGRPPAMLAQSIMKTARPIHRRRQLALALLASALASIL